MLGYFASPHDLLGDIKRPQAITFDIDNSSTTVIYAFELIVVVTRARRRPKAPRECILGRFRSSFKPQFRSRSGQISKRLLYLISRRDRTDNSWLTWPCRLARQPRNGIFRKVSPHPHQLLLQVEKWSDRRLNCRYIETYCYKYDALKLTVTIQVSVTEWKLRVLVRNTFCYSLEILNGTGHAPITMIFVALLKKWWMFKTAFGQWCPK